MLRKLTFTIVALGLAIPGCKETTVEGTNSKQLTLVKPIDTSIQRGNTAKVAILLKRTNFSDPVTVEFSELPKGVSVVETNHEIEGNERTFVLSASDTADLVKNHRSNVSLKGPDGMTATEQFSISIREKS